MSEFEILVTSHPHFEKLVAEIWFRQKLVAVVSKEGSVPELQVFQAVVGMIPFEEFMNALENANKLLE